MPPPPQRDSDIMAWVIFLQCAGALGTAPVPVGTQYALLLLGRRGLSGAYTTISLSGSASKG